MAASWLTAYHSPSSLHVVRLNRVRATVSKDSPWYHSKITRVGQNPDMKSFTYMLAHTTDQVRRNVLALRWPPKPSHRQMENIPCSCLTSDPKDRSGVAQGDDHQEQTTRKKEATVLQFVLNPASVPGLLSKLSCSNSARC